ncbi:hypothetical protein EYC84_011443 [Monilinia fructicola]|uniref:Glutaredoxin domain-containing protein n=1 Tax=Monilinia fructicola TaxID=38448 RepID=A0A5M9J9G5_MONFR|nr:hypothetical protein EYC84_011443 [Monilinia fructicola]
MKLITPSSYEALQHKHKSPLRPEKSRPLTAANMASSSTSTSYSTDPALYLYTSLTSGSSHIVTATSRLETILKANRIPFKALDIATDEKARMLWGLQEGLVLGDLVEIEDWNEYGELKQHIKIVPVSGPAPAAPPASASQSVESKPSGGAETTITLALRQATQEAAQKAKDLKKKTTEALPLPTRSIFLRRSPYYKNPDNSTWSSEPYSTSSASHRKSAPKLESVQSPTSTAWRPRDIDSILMHRGSSVSSGSAEEIKQIENEETIPEENEDK